MLVIISQIASLIIFVLGVLIIVFSLISIRIIYTNTVLHNAFGCICAVQSIAEAIVGICFTFWASPVLIFNPGVANNSVGFWVGHIILYFYFLAVWLHFCKSINRCAAIIFPLKYHLNFTIKNAKILICLVMIVALLCIATSFFYPCNLYFNTIEYIWDSRDKQCWEDITKYVERTVNVITAGGSLIFDVITWAYLLIISKKNKQHSATNSVNEKRFFVQTCMGTLLHMTTLTCSSIFICMTDNLSVKFLLNTVSWMLFHLTNQFLFMLFSIKTKTFGKRFSIFSLSSKVKANNQAAK